MGLETMSLNQQENGTAGSHTTQPQQNLKHKRSRKCRAAILALLLLLITLVLLGVILGVTVFKMKEPKTQLVSASLEGVAPRVTFPVVNIQLNVTLNLTLLVQNRNHASFNTGQGQSLLFYKGDQVGDAPLDLGLIPSRSTTTLNVLLTLEVDRFAQPGLMSLLNDVMDGEIILETKTRIPGRVKFLGIFRKHIVSSSDCQITIGFPDMKIKSQDCKQHTKI